MPRAQPSGRERRARCPSRASGDAAGATPTYQEPSPITSPEEHPVSADRLAKTLAELKTSGWQSRSVKDEVRGNFLRMLHDGEELFPGIVGYDDTVIP